jgi:multicomponent Na+:H+ antiporter subunit G
MSDVVPWVADGLILLGSIVMTIGVIGMVRLPGVFLKQHAASKAVFLGVCSFLVAVMASGDAAIIARAALIGVLLILTAPVAAHEIAKAAVREEDANWQGRGAPSGQASLVRDGAAGVAQLPQGRSQPAVRTRPFS